MSKAEARLKQPASGEPNKGMLFALKAGLTVGTVCLSAILFSFTAMYLLPGMLSVTAGAVGLSFSVSVRSVTILELIMSVGLGLFEGFSAAILWWTGTKGLYKAAMRLYDKVKAKHIANRGGN